MWGCEHYVINVWIILYAKSYFASDDCILQIVIVFWNGVHPLNMVGPLYDVLMIVV